MGKIKRMRFLLRICSCTDQKVKNVLVSGVYYDQFECVLNKIKMNFKRIVFLFFLGCISVQAQTLNTYFSAADSFFQTYVDNGKVNYKAIQENPVQLNVLVAMAKEIRVSVKEPDIYKAFWINTYNILVIKGVVEHYPLKSPLDVDGFFDNKKYAVGGNMITLNEIENHLLRAKFPNEPRFHFVLVCAGLGCPPIINEAYLPKYLENQLQRQTQKAVNDPTFIRVQGTTVNVSQIFEWYKSDFENAGGILSFINSYRKTTLPNDVEIDFYPYDWSLNSK